MYTYIRIFIYICIYIYMYIYIDARSHTRSHSLTHTHLYTHAHTHTHTHTHAHSPSLSHTLSLPHSLSHSHMHEFVHPQLLGLITRYSCRRYRVHCGGGGRGGVCHMCILHTTFAADFFATCAEINYSSNLILRAVVCVMCGRGSATEYNIKHSGVS